MSQNQVLALIPQQTSRLVASGQCQPVHYARLALKIKSYQCCLNGDLPLALFLSFLEQSQLLYPNDLENVNSYSVLRAA